ncbi:hypothetical protein GC176_21910 [bacterium]|nr:hypothetical protein [bacterium]
MAVGIRVGGIIDELGAPSFLHSFFSTISHRLEPSGWGTRFPILMNHVYQGQLTGADAGAAVVELRQARDELRNFTPSQVVWDIENLSARPPWGDNIADTITDLSNYFITSTGRDLIDTLLEALEEAEKTGQNAVIE